MNQDNLSVWNAAKSVPDYCKKTIGAGKLKGYTNVSPQWRLEKLTELFGPCGVGWIIENINYWTTEGVGESVMWCSLDLKICVDGKWSLPINGIGGSKLYGKGQGDGINDEACKMAQTDAISVACKNLGFAADVYYGLDDTKYRGDQTNFQWGAPPQAVPHYNPATTQTTIAQTPPEKQATLEQAVQLAKNAQSKDEVVKIWNDFKKAYGTKAVFKKAIADNPNNPSKR